MNLRSALPFIALAVTLTATSLNAKTVYRWVDSQGNVEYSDQARDGAEAINLGPTTTIVMPKGNETGPVDFQSESLPAEAPTPYVKLRILKPRNDEAFHSGNGNVDFEVSSEPGVSSPYQYQLLIDSKPAITTTSPAFTLENIDRGTHTVTLSVVDAEGKTVQVGDSITFTLHRPIAPRITPRPTPQAN